MVVWKKAQLNWKHTVKHKPDTSDDKDKNSGFDVLSVNHGALSVQDYFTFRLCRKSTVIMKTSTVTVLFACHSETSTNQIYLPL